MRKRKLGPCAALRPRSHGAAARFATSVGPRARRRGYSLAASPAVPPSLASFPAPPASLGGGDANAGHIVVWTWLLTAGRLRRNSTTFKTEASSSAGAASPRPI